ncbi:unnamed protein product [Linum trigynum]
MELDFEARWKHRYSLPPSTTVAQLKQMILQDFGIAPERITLKLMPYQTTMQPGHRTLASYRIPAGGEMTWLTVDIAKINVMARFTDYDNLGYPIPCYEFDSVADLRRLVVEQLRGTGVDDIGAEDMELFCGGVKCGDPGARLSQYGVGDLVTWVGVKTTKPIAALRRRITSAL